VRSIRTPERIAEVAQSLAADGQREAITVYPGTGADAGKFLIVSGVTRYRAAKSLGWEALTARVDASLDPTNALALVRVSRTHNDTVRETDLDHAYIVNALQDKKYGIKGIAAALGRPERHVERLRVFSSLPAAILELGKTKPEKFSARLAELLKRAVETIGIEKAHSLLTRTFAENLSLRELERLIRAEVRRQQRDAQEIPWQTQALEIRVEGKKVGTLGVWETPEKQCELRFSARLDKAAGAWMQERLTELCERFMEEASAGNSNDNGADDESQKN
jgi:ParB-like chromosome segregation protein Spo0J